jgi:hypothetical protein
MKKRQKNLAWLLNWIGKDCYKHLTNTTPSSKKKECNDRKNFIKDQYAKKEETKPFFDEFESKDYLIENKDKPDGAFVSRLSSRIPGEITIQHYDETTKRSRGKRFNYKTQRTNADSMYPEGQLIDDHLKKLIEGKNQYIQSHNLQNQYKLYDKTRVKNYYTKTGSTPTRQKKTQESDEEEISFQPYSIAPIIPDSKSSPTRKKKGVYLESGEFTRRAQKYDRSTLDEQFLNFK